LNALSQPPEADKKCEMEGSDAGSDRETRDKLCAAANPKPGERPSYAETAHDSSKANTVSGKVEITDSDGSADQLQGALRLKYLQQTLYNLLPATAMSDLPMDADTRTSLEQRRSAIKIEAASGEFGGATKKAYADLVGWFEKRGIPAQASRLKQLGLSTAGASDVGMQEDGSVDLGIDTNTPPKGSDLERIDAVVHWIGKSATASKEAEQFLETYDKQLEETVKSNGLPVSWLDGKDKDPANWRTSVSNMIGLALRTRSYIEIMDELNRSTSGRFPLDLPPGVKIRRGVNGNITEINLGLPSNANPEDPDNKSHLDVLQHWADAKKPQIDPVLQQLTAAVEHPELVLFWGEHELRDIQGRFDRGGNLLGIVPAGTKPDLGEELHPVNLVLGRMDIAENNGRIKGTQRIQAQNIPRFGYQNIVGAKDQGYEIEKKLDYAPDDPVVVRNGESLQLMQAKDLPSYKLSQQAKYYGEKSLLAAMDIGMTITGAIGVATVIRTVRLAAAASRVAAAAAATTGIEQVAGDVAGKALTQSGKFAGAEVIPSAQQTGMTAARSTARLLAGSTGIVNNAGARETDIGSYINTARGIYFVADLGLGLGNQGWNTVRKLALGKTTAQMSVPVESVVHFGKTIAAVNAGSEQLMSGAGLGFTGIIFPELYDGVQKLQTPQTGSLARAAAMAEADQPINR
jgi:hypothetical protein